MIGNAADTANIRRADHFIHFKLKEETGLVSKSERTTWQTSSRHSLLPSSHVVLLFGSSLCSCYGR